MEESKACMNVCESTLHARESMGSDILMHILRLEGVGTLWPKVFHTLMPYPGPREHTLTVIGWGLPRVAVAVACMVAVEPQPLGRC